MELKHYFASVSLVGSLALSACSTGRDLVFIANELQEPKTTKLILEELHESLQKSSNYNSYDKEVNYFLLNSQNFSDSNFPQFLTIEIPIIDNAYRNSSLDNSCSVIFNKYDTAINSALNDLGEGESPGRAEAQRVAVVVFSNELNPELGAAVSFGYKTADEIENYRDRFEDYLHDKTGIKFGFSFSGGLSGEPNLGVLAKKKTNILGIRGEISLDIRKQSTLDQLDNSSDSRERPIVKTSEWFDQSSSSKAMTLTLAYTVKF